MENRKEFMRNYMRDYRAKQKALTCKDNCKPNSKPNVRQADKEEEREIEKEEEREKISYQQIVDMFNSLCPSFSSVKSLSDARKKAIKARMNTYSIEDFETLFKKAESSTFLKGGNNRNWTANFDWLIKDANMAKVLDGNYDNKKTINTPGSSQDDLDDFF